MNPTTVEIEKSVAPSADLSTVAGLPLVLEDRDLRTGPSMLIEEDFVRRLAELASVVAEPLDDDPERIEYRMLNGVRRAEDTHLEGLALRYELTALTGRPIGWEAAKTAGHTHVRPPGAALGYPEVVEVLHGEAGFLMHDLTMGPDGPRSARAWLVRARAGDRVVFPPALAHVTINLGAGPLVFSDIIDRRAAGVYADVMAARGFAWYIGSDGKLRPNDRYVDLPELEECSAHEWSGAASRPLYEAFSEEPSSFEWLSRPEMFPDVAPGPWARVGHVVSSLG